jgi:hypothetical protein
MSPVSLRRPRGETTRYVICQMPGVYTFPRLGRSDPYQQLQRRDQRLRPPGQREARCEHATALIHDQPASTPAEGGNTVATTIAASAEAAFTPVIEPHTHQRPKDSAAIQLLATGKTKDLPGFDRLTGFVAFTADLTARVRRCQGKPWLRSSCVRSGPSGTDEYAEEAHHVPDAALLEH